MLKKDDLANLKAEIAELDSDKLAKLDFDKLKLVLIHLEKLSDEVNKKNVKKDVYKRSKILKIKYLILLTQLLLLP